VKLSDLSADEVFEMAKQIEKNGARFYRQAANCVVDDKNKQVLMQLAEMEDEHFATFTAMQQQLSAEERAAVVFDPDDELGLYLAAMADTRVFDVHTDPCAQLTPGSTAADVLETAIGLEKDSIVFYTGMLDLVPEKLGQHRLQDIIKQEIGHIAILSRELAAIAG